MVPSVDKMGVEMSDVCSNHRILCVLSIMPGSYVDIEEWVCLILFLLGNMRLIVNCAGYLLTNSVPSKRK